MEINLKPTLDRIIDSFFRETREKFRNCHRLWVRDDFGLMIKQAEDLEKSVRSFIAFLKRSHKKR